VSGVRRTTLAAVLASGTLLLVGCGANESQGAVANVHTYDNDDMFGIVLPKPYEIPNVTLTDANGASYSLRNGMSKPLTLVFFGYTNCPDICQVVMADIASAVNRLDAADRSQVGMLFVTTDPARDNPQVLRAYLDRFNPDFDGLTGRLGGIVKLGDALGVTIEKGQKLPTGGYDVTHSTNVIGVEPDGGAPIVWTQAISSEHLAQDIHTILSKGIRGSAKSGSAS
jgi:protein SCO1